MSATKRTPRGASRSSKPAAAAPAKTAPRKLVVDYLARVEGEGALSVKIQGDRVIQAKLRIFEPPRFFEAFLRGRLYTEAPDITARICGICPIAYQMSSSHAMEAACGVTVGGQLRALRRLIYCGEWIESHALHVYLLHAPDFLGYESGIHLAADHPEVVARALELKRIGNDLMDVVGGRSVHPINLRVGGFYRVPSKRELAAMVEPLQRALETSLDTVRLTAKLDFPALDMDYEFVALHHPDEYPLCEGRLISSRGMDIPISEYERHFTEEHVEHSNALCSRHEGSGAYFVGPLARFNLDFDQLTPLAKQAAREVGLLPPVRNPFQGIVVRAVELVFACEEALRLIAEYEPPERAFVPCEPRSAIGHGCSEAPRGILYHRYRIDQSGKILEAKIVPPTAQNQRQIEADLAALVAGNLGLSDDKLTWRCEQAIRNYDPCISCATHFLKLEIERT